MLELSRVFTRVGFQETPYYCSSEPTRASEICRDMSVVEITKSEFENKSEESSLASEEEWISITDNMEFLPLKEGKKSSIKAEESCACDRAEGSGDEQNRLSSEEQLTASNTEGSAEQHERDISVADTHIRALLRDRFLKLLSKLPGHECTVNFFERTTQKCTIRACDPYFDDIVVEDLTTHYTTTIPRAIIRVGDIISMHIEVDDIARFS